MTKDERPDVDQESKIGVTVNKGARGFVWKPWLVRWDAELFFGATTARRTVFSSSSGDAVGNDSLVRRLGGNYTILVFPSSRFPFKTSYQRAQSDSSEGEPETQGQTREKMSFSQSYRDKGGSMQLALGVDHASNFSGTKNPPGMLGVSLPGLDRPEDSSQEDRLTFSAKKRLLKHVVDLLGRLVRSERSSPEERSSNAVDSLIVNHNYEGAENWSVSTMGNLDNTHYGVTPLATDGVDAVTASSKPQDILFAIRQIVSYLSWRDKERPLTISASSRISQNETASHPDTPDESSTVTQSLNVSTMGRYQPSQAVSLGANVSVTHIGNHASSATGETQSSTQDMSTGINVTYSPEQTSWGSFDHAWSAGSSVAHHISRGGAPRTSIRENIGHSLGRVVDLGRDVTLAVSMNQGGSASQSQEAFLGWGVSHVLAGNLTRPHQKGETAVDFSLSDSRSFGDDQGFSQLANFQVASNGSVGRYFFWRGYATTQWSRESGEDQIEINRSSSAGADFSFRKPGLFGMQRLRFASQLSITVTDSLLPMGMYVGYEGEEEQRSWWNTLDYQIGKMVARLTAGGTETYGSENGLDRNGLILFELKRFFGFTY